METAQEMPVTTILLAEASPESTASLRSLLESWNYQVETLDDGAAVFKRLTGPEPPTVAILDQNLPSMSGLEVITEIRRRSHQHAVWMMLMSDEPDAEQVNVATTAKVDDFLLKPVNEFDLLVRLRTAERVQQLHRDLEEQMEAVRFHASHDNLTGVLNREAMLRQLFQETDRVQRMRTPLTLMLVDLDKFSRVNSTYGYATGDGVLKEFAHRLKRYLRSYDIVGRCGGDQFLVGLPGCLAEQAALMAERLNQTVLDKPYHIDRDLLRITASIGIATSRGRSPLVVLREAERAMGDAKLAGRDCIRCFGQQADAAAQIETQKERKLLRMP
jgi:two-component system, cell cycle response regulator